MENQRNISLEFWEYVENQNTKIAKKVYDWLNKDSLSSIIVNNDIYYFELVNSYTVMPNYIYDYLKRWCNRQGLSCLYDIKQ